MNIIAKHFVLVMLFLLLIPLACNGGKMKDEATQYKTIKEIPNESWLKLSKIKILFGHQSVGYNIIDGMRDIIKENSNVILNIVETRDLSKEKKGTFFHTKVGKNKFPKTKLTDFAEIIENGNGIDIAFVKFCYVDLMKDSDPKDIFDAYKTAMTSLKEKYPNTKFVHVTVPLISIREKSFKTWIKEKLGRKINWGYEGNIIRNRYNELLRNEYKGKEPVFDLALVESTKEDGQYESFQIAGQTYHAMVPNFSDDRGHLNEIGRKKAAENLLITLVNAM